MPFPTVNVLSVILELTVLTKRMPFELYVASELVSFVITNPWTVMFTQSVRSTYPEFDGTVLFC